MEMMSLSPYNQGPIIEATQRLERALEALEARFRALKAQADIPDLDGEAADYHRLLGEIEEVKARERVLEQAANGAFEALGQAAANIRLLLKEEAA